MSTTVRLNDALLEQARRKAAARGQTLAALIEQGCIWPWRSRDRRPAGARSTCP